MKDYKVIFKDNEQTRFCKHKFFAGMNKKSVRSKATQMLEGYIIVRIEEV